LENKELFLNFVEDRQWNTTDFDDVVDIGLGGRFLRNFFGFGKQLLLILRQVSFSIAHIIAKHLFYSGLNL